MKVYIKSKNLTGTNSLIPYNTNFANAMYGFLELGVEVKLFENWSEIKDIITKDDILVDYIDQVIYFLKKFNPNFTVFEDYPEELKKYLGRKIWSDKINHIAADESTWGNFVKPKQIKAFTGLIVDSFHDLIGCGNKNYDVWVSEPVKFFQEWRGFVYYDKLIDLRPYLHNDNIGIANNDVIKNIMIDFSKIKDKPNACSIDIGLDDKGRTLLVECNDCISLGEYGLNHIEYAKMINARQSQVLNRKDELKF